MVRMGKEEEGEVVGVMAEAEEEADEITVKEDKKEERVKKVLERGENIEMIEDKEEEEEVEGGIDMIEKEDLIKDGGRIMDRGEFIRIEMVDYLKIKNKPKLN